MARGSMVETMSSVFNAVAALYESMNTHPAR